MQRSHLALLMMLVSLAGCSDDGPSPPVEPSEPEVAVGASRAAGWLQDVDQVALMLATAMGSPDIRARIRDAMRTSKVTEHKLVLQDFLRTPTGRPVLAAMATAGGIEAGELVARLAPLPRLDFYVPVRHHRLTWEGGPDAAVVANVAVQPPTAAYRVAGGTVAIKPAKLDPSPTLFLLEFEEPKGRRVHPQADRPGRSIQDPDDGDFSVTYIDTDELGTVRVTELADLTQGGTIEVPFGPAFAKCDPEVNGGCGGGGGGGGGGTPSYRHTYLKRIQTYGICDNGFCGEGNEFEFRAVVGGSSRTVRVEGVADWDDVARNDVLFYNSPYGVGTIKVYTKETDGWMNVDGDDIFVYTTYNPNYVGPIRITTSTASQWWELKDDSHVGVFDDYKMAIYIQW